MYLENVAKTKIDESGVRQVGYSMNDFAILLTTVSKGKVFPSHHHESKQYGYCFAGAFTFIADGEQYCLAAGKEYLLQSDIVHSASALEDFYALDYRFLSTENLSKKISLIVLDQVQKVKELVIKGKKLGASEVFLLEGNGLLEISSLNISMNSVIYIMSGNEIICDCFESHYVLKPMEIYKITDIADLFVRNNRTALIIVKEEIDETKQL